MNTTIWSMTIMLFSLVFSNASIGQGQTLQCEHIRPNPEKHDLLKALFRYAQIAERPKHENNQFMEDCSWNGATIVEAPKNILPLQLTGEIEGILSALEASGIEGAYLEPGNIDGSLAIGCKGTNGGPNLPLHLKVNAYYGLARDLLNLDFSFSAEFVNRAGNIGTRSIWAPYIDKDTDMIIFSNRGTDPLDIEQIITNYIGDECAFPAMKIAVSHVCDAFRQELKSEFEANRFNIGENQLEDIRGSIRASNLNFSTALTGHSLGGQAVQYVVDNMPRACLANLPNTNDSLRSYAFASTRNPTQEPEENGSQSALNNQSILESYLISGDQILERLGLGQGQTGRVITYLPDSWFQSPLETRHSIEAIQDSVCDCLRKDGQISIRRVSKF